MASVFFWAFIFSLANTVSIVLLGSRSLISGNLLDFHKIAALLINWKFIVSMVFALVARASFIMTNNALLKIPRLEASSTTVTTFITVFSLILVVLANYFFLKERINITQGVGATFILFGIMIMTFK